MSLCNKTDFSVISIRSCPVLSHKISWYANPSGDKHIRFEAGTKGIDLSFCYVNYIYRATLFNPRIRHAVTRFLALELKIGTPEPSPHTSNSSDRISSKIWVFTKLEQTSNTVQKSQPLEIASCKNTPDCTRILFLWNEQK